MDLNQELWLSIAEISDWIDDSAADDYRYEPLAQHWARIAKIQEEAGEVVSAYIGATGQNGRKGVTNDMDKVYDELSDVAATAILALYHFTQDTAKTEEILWNKLVSLRERVPPEMRITGEH